MRAKITDAIRRSVLHDSDSGRHVIDIACAYGCSISSVRNIIKKYGSVRGFEESLQQGSVPKPIPKPSPAPVSTAVQPFRPKNWRENLLARKVREGKVQIQLTGELRNEISTPGESWLEKTTVMTFMECSNGKTAAIVRRTEGMRNYIDFCVFKEEGF